MNSSDWITILDQARNKCYTQNVQTKTNLQSQGKFCDFIFDGLMCWPRTPAGQLAKQQCENNYLTSQYKGFATKYCMENGRWFVHNLTNKEWTNLTDCGLINLLKESTELIYREWVPVIRNVTYFGHIISIVSLIISIFIFIKIKRLHCARNRLHIHLFVSFVIRGVMSLTRNSFFTQENTWLCKMVTTLNFYFILSNYMFILMEGFYLNNLMFVNLFSENRVAVYCVAGWVLPLLPIIPWTVLKALKENSDCWSTKNNKYIELLIEIPIGLSIIINFIIFTIIMRILFVKLKSMHLEEQKIRYRKLLRSTLILVPLFGIPYTVSLILKFYINKNETIEILWLFFDQTFISFHGLFASLIYCMSNSEVQMEIKRKYHSFKDRKNSKEFRRIRTISHTTQMPLNEELQEFPQQFNTAKKLIEKKVSNSF